VRSNGGRDAPATVAVVQTPETPSITEGLHRARLSLIIFGGGAFQYSREWSEWRCVRIEMRALLRLLIAFAVCASFRGLVATPALSKLGRRRSRDRCRGLLREYLSPALIVFALAAGQLGFSCSPAAADAMPTNTIMNSFVKVGSKQVDFIVRIPMDLLPGLPFPQKGSQYDLAASSPVVEIAVQALADGFILWENGSRLTATNAVGRLSANSDRSFEHYESAVAHVDRPPDPSEKIPVDQAFFDLHLTYPISSPKSVFRIQSKVAADWGDATKLLVRYMPLSEGSRAFIISGGSGPMPLNPSWYIAAASFVLLGIEHILSGTDHLLFLFCLVIPFRRWRGLFSVITAFTLAHSVTLFASAFHLAPQGAWFPPFVETAIAASIVYMALENLYGPDLRRRWFITGMFGLVHGFGFADILAEKLQFAGSYLVLSLFSFNVGIELGQMIVLVLLLPVLALCRRFVPERALVVTLSAIGALVSGYWMIERFQVLRQQQWPSVEDLISLARWPALVLLVGGAVALIVKWVKRKTAYQTQSPATTADTPSP
jgi:hydrogenase/urease accessory protein HupE